MAKRLNFYDLKAKKPFISQSYVIKTRTVKGNVKKFAVAKSPYSGNDSWRVLPKDFKK